MAFWLEMLLPWLIITAAGDLLRSKFWLEGFYTIEYHICSFAKYNLSLFLVCFRDIILCFSLNDYPFPLLSTSFYRFVP